LKAAIVTAFHSIFQKKFSEEEFSLFPAAKCQEKAKVSDFFIPTSGIGLSLLSITEK